MIPLYKPYMPEELPEMDTILHSGALSYGKWGRKFEEELGKYIENPNVFVVNSFNSAMLVVLTTLGIRPSEEVIASPMSCLASNQPFATLSAKVVWADIDPETGTLSPDSVAKMITPKTKAIFHNHHCGYPGYIDEINEIGKKNGIFVVDDAIEAFGSEYKGNKIGNTGSDATVFSFQTVRLPNAIDGGAVAFRDKTFIEKVKLIRDLGVDRNIFRNLLGEISSKCDILEPGYGATLSEPNSYIGCLQLGKIEKLLNMQRENARTWKENIVAEYPQYKIFGKPFQNPNYWVFGVLVPNKQEAILHFRDKDFFASGVHLPNNKYSVFGQYEKLPGVKDFFSRFVALPCGWWINKENLL
ncbi:DegT/DnrJ/EryC1/StrS aminotransferase family protein [bacterium]|nr:DegT/DnrJ/EryC1/StrS aminotransferase family protein [bacterium]